MLKLVYAIQTHAEEKQADNIIISSLSRAHSQIYMFVNM